MICDHGVITKEELQFIELIRSVDSTMIAYYCNLYFRCYNHSMIFGVGENSFGAIAVQIYYITS